jgi:hypothetical protein
MLGGAALELKIAILQYRYVGPSHPKVQRKTPPDKDQGQGFWRWGTIKVFVIHKFAAPPCGRVPPLHLPQGASARLLRLKAIAVPRRRPLGAMILTRKGPRRPGERHIRAGRVQGDEPAFDCGP